MSREKEKSEHRHRKAFKTIFRRGHSHSHSQAQNNDASNQSIAKVTRANTLPSRHPSNSISSTNPKPPSRTTSTDVLTSKGQILTPKALAKQQTLNRRSTYSTSFSSKPSHPQFNSPATELFPTSTTSSNGTFSLGKKFFLGDEEEQLKLPYPVANPNTFLPIELRLESANFNDMFDTLTSGHKHFKKLGDGASASVLTVSRKSDNKIYALKRFTTLEPDEKPYEFYIRIAKEYSISKPLIHPNIVETIALVTLSESKGWGLVVEYCEYGDLFSVISSYSKHNVKIQAEHRNCLFKQILRGVAYIHHMGIVHRDIKPENILINEKSVVKIGDFGSADYGWKDKYDASKGIQMSTFYVGSPPYLAPEVLELKDVPKLSRTPYDPFKVDTWAIAITYYCMITFHNPFREARSISDEEYRKFKNTFERHVLNNPSFRSNGRDANPPLSTFANHFQPAAARTLIFHMMDPDPNYRWSVAKVLQDPWVKRIEMCVDEDDCLKHPAFPHYTDFELPTNNDEKKTKITAVPKAPVKSMLDDSAVVNTQPITNNIPIESQNGETVSLYTNYTYPLDRQNSYKSIASEDLSPTTVSPLRRDSVKTNYSLDSTTGLKRDGSYRSMKTNDSDGHDSSSFPMDEDLVQSDSVKTLTVKTSNGNSTENGGVKKNNKESIISLLSSSNSSAEDPEHFDSTNRATERRKSLVSALEPVDESDNEEPSNDNQTYEPKFSAKNRSSTVSSKSLFDQSVPDSPLTPFKHSYSSSSFGSMNKTPSPIFKVSSSVRSMLDDAPLRSDSDPSELTPPIGTGLQFRRKSMLGDENTTLPTHSQYSLLTKKFTSIDSTGVEELKSLPVRRLHNHGPYKSVRINPLVIGGSGFAH